MLSTKATNSVTILVALQVEADSVKRALALRGMPANSFPVCVIGPGGVQLPRLSASFGHIIMAGIGGGLDPDLRLGDVIIDGLPPGCPLPHNSREGRIASAEQVVSTPGLKASLFTTSGASVVDMEQAGVRAWAGPIPVVGVRAVLDTRHDLLPEWTAGLVTSSGGTDARAVIGMLLSRPYLIPQLIRLGGQSRRATRAAAAVAVDLALWISTHHPTAYASADLK